ncbi:hypothetical protein E2C01_045764 [Portunus trituberculatus]|uniref:Uncharacterized protein n=1 Tax=Portunus trituberculatus TaxID=210409 RepID=A0A5B7G2X0_PORTR|nr:hypothetical protein [Portunus trituberculatus]
MAIPNPASESLSGEGIRNVPSKFFDYLTSKVEQILSLYPFAEINVHHQLCLFSPFTDYPGELVFNFAILHDLEQLVQHSIRIPDRSPKAEVPLAFFFCQLGDLRRYYADFPWNAYCFRVRDPSLCAERITEVIVSGM